MALSGPNEQDVRKIHAEVTQLVHERFLLTTVAITAFGVVSAWFVSKVGPTSGDALGGFAFAASILLTSLLFVLYVFSHLLKNVLKVFTTYLIVTGASGWEQDAKRFRDPERAYLGYTGPQTLVFLFLTAVATGFPLLLCLVYSLRPEPRDGLWSTLVAGCVYMVLMWGMGFLDWGHSERKAEARWRALQQDRGSVAESVLGELGTRRPPNRAGAAQGSPDGG